MKRITLNQFFDIYTASAPWTRKSDSTKRTDMAYWKNHLAPALGSKILDKISQDDIEVFLATKDSLKAATVARIKAVLSAIFTEAVRRKMIKFNPTNNVILNRSKKEFDNARCRFLTPDEIGKLLTALKARSLDLYQQALLSLHTGMRAGEIFNLKWQDVNFDGNQISVKAAKNGKTRFIPMDRIITHMLFEKKSAEYTPDSLVFPSKVGTKREWVSITFADVVKSLGLNDGRDSREKIVFHSLRHTAASLMVNAGIPIYTVQQILGHANVSTTQRYSHVSDTSLKNAIDSLADTLDKSANLSVRHPVKDHKNLTDLTVRNHTSLTGRSTKSLKVLESEPLKSTAKQSRRVCRRIPSPIKHHTAKKIIRRV